LQPGFEDVDIDLPAPATYDNAAEFSTIGLTVAHNKDEEDAYESESAG